MDSEPALDIGDLELKSLKKRHMANYSSYVQIDYKSNVLMMKKFIWHPTDSECGLEIVI